MARTTPQVNTSWVFYSPIRINSAIVDDETDGLAVTYVLSHNGATIDTGSLEWEPEGRDGVWGKKITLPSTPGTLTMTVTVTLGDDVGTGSHSIYVEKYS